MRLFPDGTQRYRQRYGKVSGADSGATITTTPVTRLDIAVDRTNILAGSIQVTAP
jgi:hypothetical protein